MSPRCQALAAAAPSTAARSPSSTPSSRTTDRSAQEPRPDDLAVFANRASPATMRIAKERVGVDLGIEGPGDSGTEIIEFGKRGTSCQDLTVGDELVPQSLGKFCVVGGVCPPRRFDLTMGVQLLSAVLAQCLQYRIPRDARLVGLRAEHRLARQLVSVSITSHSSTSLPPTTLTAASLVNDPGKTPRWSKTTRSDSSSIAYDHSTVARNVWWRSTP